jgi:hypothetical protein
MDLARTRVGWPPKAFETKDAASKAQFMTNNNANNAVVAIYTSHAEAEAAVKELERSGFDMEKLSIVGRDCHTEEHVTINRTNPEAADHHQPSPTNTQECAVVA